MVDNYHRFKACSELGVNPIPYTVPEKVKIVAEALEYSFDINLARRHLNHFQKAEWAYKVKYPLEVKKAKLRATTLKGIPSPAVGDHGEASALTAKAVGIGRTTFLRSKKIVDTNNKGSNPARATPTLSKKAKENMARTGRGDCVTHPLGRVTDAVAKAVGIGGTTFKRAKKIIETYNKGLLSKQVLNYLRSGKLVRLLCQTLKKEKYIVATKNLWKLETLDKETKGIISEHIDRLIEQKDLTDRTEWIIEAITAHYKIKSNEMLDKMLISAYALGSLISNIVERILLDRFFQKTDELTYRRWVKKFGREKADKMLAEDIVRKTKAKGKAIEVGMTEEEYNYIRDKLIPMVPQLEVKINQELALKKAKGEE